jgi:hypothetical protein
MAADRLGKSALTFLQLTVFAELISVGDFFAKVAAGLGGIGFDGPRSTLVHTVIHRFCG